MRFILRGRRSTTSPDNQPHYFIWPRKQLHDIKTGHATTIEQQKGSTSKEMIWALRWSVALRTFYRQILSLLYSSFPFGNIRPRACPGSTGIFRAYLYWHSSVRYEALAWSMLGSSVRLVEAFIIQNDPSYTIMRNLIKLVTGCETFSTLSNIRSLLF